MMQNGIMSQVQIKAYKDPSTRVKIEQTRVKREWMDNTAAAHAYKCFPVTLANTIGWSISFLDDIEVIWDGISEAEDSHVKIIKDPGNVCSTSRANGTISFYTGIFFKTDENTTMLQIVPPNYFIDGATPFTSLISTSFYGEAIPVAWKITRPNTVISIPAGTPVATFIPISLKKLNDTELIIEDMVYTEDFYKKRSERSIVWAEKSKDGFTNFYRDAVEYDGTSLGEHEVKSIKLKIVDNSSPAPEFSSVRPKSHQSPRK
jgi:hypothetical protein